MLQEPEPSTRTKYTKEARGLFGVMLKKNADGEMVGLGMLPCDYTGQKVVGPAAYEKAFWTEVRRVNSLKTTGTSRYVYTCVRT